MSDVVKSLSEINAALPVEPVMQRKSYLPVVLAVISVALLAIHLHGSFLSNNPYTEIAVAVGAVGTLGGAAIRNKVKGRTQEVNAPKEKPLQPMEENQPSLEEQLVVNRERKEDLEALSDDLQLSLLRNAEERREVTRKIADKIEELDVMKKAFSKKCQDACAQVESRIIEKRMVKMMKWHHLLKGAEFFKGEYADLEERVQLIEERHKNVEDQFTKLSALYKKVKHENASQRLLEGDTRQNRELDGWFRAHQENAPQNDYAIRHKFNERFEKFNNSSEEIDRVLKSIHNAEQFVEAFSDLFIIEKVLQMQAAKFAPMIEKVREIRQNGNIQEIEEFAREGLERAKKKFVEKVKNSPRLREKKRTAVLRVKEEHRLRKVAIEGELQELRAHLANLDADLVVKREQLEASTREIDELEESWDRFNQQLGEPGKASEIYFQSPLRRAKAILPVEPIMEAPIEAPRVEEVVLAAPERVVMGAGHSFAERRNGAGVVEERVVEEREVSIEKNTNNQADIAAEEEGAIGKAALKVRRKKKKPVSVAEAGIAAPTQQRTLQDEVEKVGELQQILQGNVAQMQHHRRKAKVVEL